MSLEEFLALPEVKPNLEYDDGVVRQKVAAKIVHGTLQGFLSSAFNQVAAPRRLGLASPETRFVSPGWAPVPDVAYYRRARIRLRGGRLPDDMHEAPDIAVEIVSPGQSVTELIRKCLRYLSLGTTVALLVDPDPETVMAFRPGQPLRLLRGSDRLDLDDVLPGLDLAVQGLFDAIAPDWLEEEAEPVRDDAAQTEPTE
jgi:Uma2 family endonuclease